MSPTEAAYLAGFVDGEGTVGIVKAKRKENRFGYRLQPYFTIPNTDVNVLVRIQEMCGNGRLVQQTNPANPHHKPGYALRFSPNQIRHVLPQIRPYLIIKARQADYMFEFLAVNVGGRNQSQEQQDKAHELRNAVCALNAKGVATVQ